VESEAFERLSESYLWSTLIEDKCFIARGLPIGEQLGIKHQKGNCVGAPDGGLKRVDRARLVRCHERRRRECCAYSPGGYQCQMASVEV